MWKRILRVHETGNAELINVRNIILCIFKYESIIIIILFLEIAQRIKNAITS